jgi:two-component system, OmpR family, sensor histidine kinase KdpD
MMFCVKKRLMLNRNWNHKGSIKYLLVALWMFSITVLSLVLHRAFTQANFALIYMMALLVVAITQGTRPALFALAISYAAFNFYLLEPFFAFNFTAPNHLIDLLIFLVAAVVIGEMATQLKEQVRQVQQQADEQQVLYALVSSFNQLSGKEGVYSTLREVLQQNLGAQSVEFLAEKSQGLDSNIYTIPLQVGEFHFGSLKVTFSTPLNEIQSRLLMACALQAAVALQRINLTEHAQLSKESDELKTAILHSISHDLRTPLTIIKTATSNFLNVYENLSADERIEMIREVDSEADHLNKLVGSLLDLSRLKANAIVLNLDWNSLEEVTADVVARLWQVMHQERVNISFQEDFPLVRFDYSLILQAVTNLLENAVRYEPLEQFVQLRGIVHDKEVHLAIISHGPTISPEEREQVMEPFYHGKDGHIGLGLAIARGIIEAHYGRIWIEETHNGGASFIFALPLTGEKLHEDSNRR